MTQLSPTALEMVARAVFSARGWPDIIHPAFEHEQEDWEACATAAITAYLAQAEKEGWVLVPLNPNYDMGEAGMAKFASFHDEHPAACVDEIYRAMLAAAQNGGE